MKPIKIFWALMDEKGFYDTCEMLEVAPYCVHKVLAVHDAKEFGEYSVAFLDTGHSLLKFTCELEDNQDFIAMCKKLLKELTRYQESGGFVWQAMLDKRFSRSRKLKIQKDVFSIANQILGESGKVRMK